MSPTMAGSLQHQPEGARIRRALRVQGIVQGVGFRPFVFNLAERLGLGGYVLNDAEGVTLEVEGSPGSVEAFLAELRDRPPPLARIDRTEAEDRPPCGEGVFRIVESRAGAERTTLVSPDVGTCDECLAEVRDPGERRYRYPFTNCTNCGPRFTITRDVPYDRPNTTMAAFPMCRDCEAEYRDPRDRRFHAQPIACPVCGPALRLTDSQGGERAGDPLAEAARLLADGRILAMKGIGGYHLACDAASETATAELRARKHREDKPFALMVRTVEAVRAYADVRPEEAGLLTSHRRPIVLLRRLPPDAGHRARVAAAVAPGTRYLGFMLPYTPLHHLLLDELDALAPAGPPPVLVMTSANRSDEPIAYRDDEAYERLGDIADAFLVHNRQIHIRCDDSVVRVLEAAPYPMRRARGFAPEPLTLARPVPAPVLAVGAELKHTFCVAKQDRAFLSHHIGDLENWETMRSFLEGVEHFTRIFDAHPEVVAHDLHPEYLSTKWALEQVRGETEPLPGVDLTGTRVVGVQHHHAHIASCLADNGAEGPVIGLALDGTGWGDDGTIWGCEALVADLAGYRRAGHLRTVTLAGGAASIREPWRMAAVYLDAAFGDAAPGLPLAVVEANAARWGAVVDLARRGVNSFPASSAGRLFDAVAALVTGRRRANYEGQAAVELEQAADPSETAAYECPMGSEDGMLVLDGVELVRAAAVDLLAGASPARVAAAFHNGFARGLVEWCRRLRGDTGLTRVALSGGTFQNLLLLERVMAGLRAGGFEVLLHRRVPPNDGGIALGQAASAAARR
jgi:hydrogenase maturation protein HypF